MREEGGFVTPSWEALLECFEAPNGQHLPLFWREPAKNNKLKLAGNAVKNNQNTRKFLLVHNLNFTCKNQQRNM
jgi:hypothetical protein